MSRFAGLLGTWTIGLAAAACASDTSGPTASPDLLPYTRTYTVTAVDSFVIPYVQRLDSGCQYLNTGGWLSLAPDGGYQLLLDHVRALCPGGTGGGGEALYQAGTYDIASGVLHLRPSAGYGAAASGNIRAAAVLAGGGFTQADVVLTFNGRVYDLVALFQPPR